MNRPNRDLLVLLKQELLTPQAMERQVEMLHELLYNVEQVENLIIAYEIINVNKYKVSSKPNHLRSIFRQRELKPFVFLNCKN